MSESSVAFLSLYLWLDIFWMCEWREKRYFLNSWILVSRSLWINHLTQRARWFQFSVLKASLSCTILSSFPIEAKAIFFFYGFSKHGPSVCSMRISWAHPLAFHVFLGLPRNSSSFSCSRSWTLLCKHLLQVQIPKETGFETTQCLYFCVYLIFSLKTFLLVFPWS